MGEHYYSERLRAFMEELAQAGFEPVAGSDRLWWRGPVHPAFCALTDATGMDIVIRPGWPFRPPDLFVKGINTNHSTLNGLVCLWRDGDRSFQWATVEGFYERIGEWCENAEIGWEDDDLGRDAFLNFREKYAMVATFDLPGLGTREGEWGDCHGSLHGAWRRIDVSPGRGSSASGHLRGLWLHAGTLGKPPPRQLSEVWPLLNGAQRSGLERALNNRRRPEALSISGGVDFILFCWDRRGRPDLLVMALRGRGENVEAFGIQPGPRDEDSLILRAGRDAPILRPRRATLFGAGALGGHVATTLAESGLGFLEIVDGDVLLPGNVVRHVASHSHVGSGKVEAVKAVISDHAPWTEVSTFRESPLTPVEIGQRITNADIVIDATGNQSFTEAVAIVALGEGKPLVSGALYRGGFIGRVRRQVLPEDTPIHLREESARYPVVPRGPATEDFAIPELGCSAPVNNAPPALVLACASLIAEVAIDALADLFKFSDEEIHVYRAIAEPQFNLIGRLSKQVSSQSQPGV